MPKKEASSERVKLDEILKSLLTVSSKVLINMLNSLFKENYAAEATEVSFASNEFVDDAYNIQPTFPTLAQMISLNISHGKKVVNQTLFYISRVYQFLQRKE